MDVSRLVPEAKAIAASAGEVYLQLYLEPAAFSKNDDLPLALCIAIQWDLAAISPAPFRYIQCYAHPCALPPGQVGPIPGAYALLEGRLPVPEATADGALQVIERGVEFLRAAKLLVATAELSL